MAPAEQLVAASGGHRGEGRRRLHPLAPGLLVALGLLTAAALVNNNATLYNYSEPKSNENAAENSANAVPSTRFVPMKINNHPNGSLCAAERYSTRKHMDRLGRALALFESLGLPYWHNRGNARIASRFGAGLIEVRPGNILGPDHDLDLMVLADNETHWTAAMRDMAERCPAELFCVVKVEWKVPTLYVWKIGKPVRYANLKPVYRRNATHGQYHPYHREPAGRWTPLSDLFPLRKAKFWRYELPVARESWDDCPDGLNLTRVYGRHSLSSTEERRRARRLLYGCARNLSAAGYASYFHCFDGRGFYNGEGYI